MLVFSNRLDLVRKFREWAKENWIADTPENLLAYLQMNELLREGEVKIFLYQAKKREKHGRHDERT